MRIVCFCIIMCVIIPYKIQAKQNLNPIFNESQMKSAVMNFYKYRKDELDKSFQKYFGINPDKKRETEGKSGVIRTPEEDTLKGMNALQLAIQKSQVQCNNIVSGKANNLTNSSQMAAREVLYPERELCGSDSTVKIVESTVECATEIHPTLKRCTHAPCTSCPMDTKELNISIAEKLRQEMHEKEDDNKSEVDNLALMRAKCILAAKIKEVQDLNHEILEVQAVAGREKERLSTLEDLAKKVKCLKTDYTIQLTDINKHIRTAQKAEAYLNKFKLNLRDEIVKVQKIIQAAKDRVAESTAKLRCKQKELDNAKQKSRLMAENAALGIKKIKCND